METKRASLTTYAYYLWAFFERFGSSVCSFAGNLALAYLLTPDDFGLVAMLGVFTAVSYILIDCGLSDALLNIPHPTARDFDTVFWFNTGVGLAIALLYAALAPVVADTFHKPELQMILTVIGLNALPSALSVAPLTWLRSRLQFRTVAVLNIAATAIAIAAALATAWATRSYWALVVLQIAYTLALLTMLAARVPRLPRLRFDTARFRRFWLFGSNLLVSAVVTQISQNIFALVLGGRYSTTQAGYFGQAQKLQQTPVNSLEAAVSSTTFIIGGKHNDSQRSAIARRMFTRFTLLLAVVCCEVIAVASPMIHCILPDKWIPAIAYLQLLFAWALVYPVNNYMMAIFKLFDSTHIIRNIICVERSLLIVAVFALWRFGVAALVGVATALSAATLIVNIILAARATASRVGWWIWAYVRSLAVGALLAAPSAVIAALMPPAWTTFVAAVLIWTALVAGSIFLLNKKHPNLCRFSP